MADLNDVLNAFKGFIARIVYPFGIGQPSIFGSNVSGVIIESGWPISEQLDNDIALNPQKPHISIFPRPEEKDTSRLTQSEFDGSFTAPLLTAALTHDVYSGGMILTLGGTIQAGDVIGVQFNNASIGYAIQESDTLASTAAAIAALIFPITPATSADNSVTVPNARNYSVIIGGSGTTELEVRRQEKLFQITIWAADPDMRDRIAKAIDPQLSRTYNFFLPDNSQLTTRYGRSNNNDEYSKRWFYRRDLFYYGEWATTISIPGTTFVAPVAKVDAQITNPSGDLLDGNFVLDDSTLS